MLAIEGGFPHTQRVLLRGLLDAPPTDVGEWQSQDVRDRPEMMTHEIQNVIFDMVLPTHMDELADVVQPNLPWAEDHFRERVSGEPMNPPPSAKDWPFAQKGNEEHTDDENKFSHTYPERMWPKFAGVDPGEKPNPIDSGRWGIRFKYGDLGDVVKQLAASPGTRQAYLPIWFPEDTGNVMKERVPCSLGYHFLIREDQLHITYMIRSCDFVRHFPDDVYMAGRLAQWVVGKINRAWSEEFAKTGNHPGDCPIGVAVGSLTMHIMSMHIFHGDIPILEKKVNS